MDETSGGLLLVGIVVHVCLLVPAQLLMLLMLVGFAVAKARVSQYGTRHVLVAVGY
jgi:hypothetical protein